MTSTATDTLHILETKRLRGDPPHPLARAWKSNRLERTEALVGRTIRLDHSEDTRLIYTFDGEVVSWENSGTGVVEEGRGSAPYDAVEARDDLFFVEYVDEPLNMAVSLVLDIEGGNALIARNIVVDIDGNRVPADKNMDWRQFELRQELLTARVDGADPEFLPHLTGDLVGKRWYAEYAPDIIAEHVYMNPSRIAWQGLGSEDKYATGAECDLSSLWKMRHEGLYVLTWVEDYQPVGAVLLMDYSLMRNTGALFGVDDDGVVHELCGAKLGYLGDTEYPKGYGPAPL